MPKFKTTLRKKDVLRRPEYVDRIDALPTFMAKEHYRYFKNKKATGRLKPLKRAYPKTKKKKSRRQRKVRSIKSFTTIRRVLYSGDKEKIKRIDNERFKLLLNVLANILNRRIEVNPKLFKDMYKHKHLFRRLADPKDQNIDHKKRYILNQRGGFFGALLARLIPVVTRVAARVIPAVTNIASKAVPLAAKAVDFAKTQLPNLVSGAVEAGGKFATTKALEAIEKKT